MSKQLMSVRSSPAQSSWDFNTSKQLMSVRLSPGQSSWDFNTSKQLITLPSFYYPIG